MLEFEPIGRPLLPESDAGKTIAAELIANAPELDLLRIDLTTIVSKYVGETEKNLRRLLNAAQEDHAILFFDEVDSLFVSAARSKTALIVTPIAILAISCTERGRIADWRS